MEDEEFAPARRREPVRRQGRMGSSLELGAFKMLLKEDDNIEINDEEEEEDTNPVHSKLEDQLTNEALKKLEKIFEEADIDGGGGLDMEEFRFAMRKTLGDHLTDQELDMIFMKVDTNCDETVDWDEYLSYMLLEYREKDQMNSMARRRPFPQTTDPVSNLDQFQRHHDSFVNILYSPNAKKFDNVYQPLAENVSPGRYLTVSKDGVINFWSMDLKHFKRFQLERRERGSIWVTVATAMPNTNMLAIATTSSTITFYELNMNTFVLNLVMSDLEIAATAMDYWYDPVTLNYSVLLWGDLRGNIHIMSIQAGDHTCPLSPSSAGRREQKMTISQVQQGIISGLTLFKIPKAQGDQILEIHYFPTLEMFMSCCREKTTALLLSDLKYRRPTYFQQYKGTFSFDYSPQHNFIVTGGKDTIVRVWSPYIVTKPVMFFQGHKEAVAFVRIDEEFEQVISISIAKDILIFDLNTQTCIQSIYKKYVNLGPQLLSACYFNPFRRGLLLSSNKLVIFQHKGDEWRSSQPCSQPTPVSCVLFNTLFNQVVSGGLDSMVMVWDVETGERVMQFTAHREHVNGEERLIPITMMCFDTTLRRLATAARNGGIKLWNFNNGACLREVEEGSPANLEVTGLVWPLNRILAVGWSQRLICYMDSQEDESIHYCPKYHIDDIVAMAFKEPSTLATASNDGDIIIWSLDNFRPTVCFNVLQSLRPQSCRKLLYNIENSVQQADNFSDITDFSEGPHVKGTPGTRDSADTLAKSSHGGGDILDSTSLFSQLNITSKDHLPSALPSLRKLPPINKDKSREDSLVEKKESHSDNHSNAAEDAQQIGGCDYTIKRLAEQKVIPESDKPETTRFYTGSKEGQKLMEHWYITTMLFLQCRKNAEDTATLVSAGARGWVNFWSVHHSGGVKAIFNAAHYVGSDITALATDPENKVLVTGDLNGYLKVWHIAGFCTRDEDDNMTEHELSKMFPFLKIELSLKKSIQSQSRHGLPPFKIKSNVIKAPLLLTSLRAHTKGILSLDYVPDADVIISGSTDCSIRMHSISGEFISIFGVEETWKSNPLQSNIEENPMPKPTNQSCSDFAGIVSLVNKNLPPDIRRIASATTLKVLFRGISPLYNLVRNIIMVWVPMLRALQFRKKGLEPIACLEEERLTEEHRKENQSKEREVILGHHLKIPRKHKPLPAINKPRMHATQCAVYSSLPCYALAKVSTEMTPPPMILEMQERNQAVMLKQNHPRRRSDCVSRPRTFTTKSRATRAMNRFHARIHERLQQDKDQLLGKIAE